MIKKIIIILLTAILILLCFEFYKEIKKTEECWWGVLYPTLSYVGFEDEDEKVSSLEYKYFGKNTNEQPVKIKIAIIEWIKKFF